MQKYLNTVEIELKSFIENLLNIKGYKINFEKNDLTKLHDLLKEKKADKIIQNFRTKTVDFNTYIDIILLLFVRENGLFMTEKSIFERKLIMSTGKELKNFRNAIQHSKENNLDNEMKQRFFEDVYLFFKYINIPIGRDVYSDFLKKDLTYNLKMITSFNLYNEYAFDIGRCDEDKADIDNEIQFDPGLFKFHNNKEKLFNFNLDLSDNNSIDIYNHIDSKLSISILDNNSISKISFNDNSISRPKINISQFDSKLLNNTSLDKTLNK
jgi:hypothetical protein